MFTTELRLVPVSPRRKHIIGDEDNDRPSGEHVADRNLEEGHAHQRLVGPTRGGVHVQQ